MRPGRPMPACPDVDKLRSMVAAGCLQAELIRHFRKNGKTMKKWLVMYGIPSPRKPYRKPPPSCTGSIYTSKHRTWNETNTQEKIDALFTPEQRARFWSKVDRRGEGECWLWSGPQTKGSRYGQHNLKSRNHRANRVAYMLTNGPIPADLHIMHLCNTRLCCNPAHLKAGTIQENIVHREKYGNTARGIRSGRRKLRADEVYAIRESSEPPRVLGDRFNIHHSMINMIRRRKKWRSLPERSLP